MSVARVRCARALSRADVGRGRGHDLQRDHAARPRSRSGRPSAARPRRSGATSSFSRVSRSACVTANAASIRCGTIAPRSASPPPAGAAAYPSPAIVCPAAHPPNSRLSRPYASRQKCEPVRRKSAAAHAVRPKPTTACAQQQCADARPGRPRRASPGTSATNAYTCAISSRTAAPPRNATIGGSRDRGRSGRTSSAAAQASTERPTSDSYAGWSRGQEPAPRSATANAGTAASSGPSARSPQKNARAARAGHRVARERARRGQRRHHLPGLAPAHAAGLGRPHREHQRDRGREQDARRQRPRRLYRLSRAPLAHRQPQGETRAGRRRLQHHRAAVVAGDEVHLGEAEPDALADRPRGEERVEDLRSQLGRHTRPVVGEAQGQVATRRSTRSRRAGRRATPGRRCG